MAYSDFTLEKFCNKFNFELKNCELFKEYNFESSLIFKTILQESQKISLSSEKARSEAIIFPILQEVSRHNNYEIGIYSGSNLNANPSKELNGECDFILSTKNQKYLVQSPIFGLVEAKKDDINDNSIGQCAAQMYGARILNERDNNGIYTIFGAVTTGEIWQFMKLEDQTLWIDEKRYYIDRVEQILGILQNIVDKYKVQ